MKDHNYFTYIMTNSTNSTLYIGVTNNLESRVWDHKNKTQDGFTKKYNCTKLVYFENCPDINAAIYREKQLKKWNRAWKFDLIKEENPGFIDLAKDWYKDRTFNTTD